MSDFEISKDAKPNERLLDDQEHDLEAQNKDKNSNIDKDYEKELTGRELRLDQLKNVSEHAQKVYIALIFGVILSLMIATMGIVLITKQAATIGGILLVFGLTSGLSFGFAMHASEKYAGKCKDILMRGGEENPEILDQSQERTMFNIALYLMMMLLLVFLVLSITCLGYQDEAKYKIKGIGQNSTTWKSIFGDLTYDYVISNVGAVLTVCGVFSIILTLFLAILLYFAFKMLASYRSWQTVIQFLCLIFLLLGFVFLYLSIYAQRYKDVTKVDKAIPAWVPDGLFGISIVAICVGIFGYVSAWTENHICLKIFTAVTAVFTMVIIVLAIGGSLFGGKFKDFFEDKCSLILDNINQDYLVKYIGCDRKYTFTSSNLEDMKCPKERIVTDWEINIFVDIDKQKEMYGCLDMGCCYKSYAFIKGTVDILGLVAFILFIFGCLLVGGSWYMVSHLELHIEEGSVSKQTQYVLLTFSAFVALVMIIFILLIPASPQPAPTETAVFSPAPVNTTLVNPQSIIQADITKIIQEEKQQNIDSIKNQTKVLEDSSKCGKECPQLRYHYQLSTDDGKFKQAPSNQTKIAPTKNEQKNNGWVVSFDGSSQDLPKFTGYYTFTPHCPLTPSKINIKVTATAINGPNSSQSPSFLQKKSRVLKQPSYGPVSSVNDTTVIDLSKLEIGKTYQVLDKDFEYSFVDLAHPQIVLGKVLKFVDNTTSAPVDNAKVTITPIGLAQCPSTVITTDNYGDFVSKKIYHLKENTPISYKLEINSPDLSDYQRLFNIGGLGWTSQINFGLIELWSNNFNDKTSLSSITINSLNNEKLDNVTVSLYAGFKALENKEVTPNVDNLLQLKYEHNSDTDAHLPPEANFVAKNYTNKDGLFKFNQLVPGIYSLVFEKEGFYTEIHHIDVIGTKTIRELTVQMTPIVEEGQMRFVLSWPDGPKDLDIHTLFKINRFSKCEVYFGKKECGGAYLDTDTFKEGPSGVETISLNNLGSYIYTFAVHKYIDTSGGIDESERPVQGAADPSHYNSTIIRGNTTVPDVKLTQSKAKISVYTSGYIGKIYEIEIPPTSEENLLPGEKPNKSGEYNWWLAFCMNGNDGINSLTAVNKLSADKPNFTFCENIFPAPSTNSTLSS